MATISSASSSSASASSSPMSTNDKLKIVGGAVSLVVGAICLYKLLQTGNGKKSSEADGKKKKKRSSKKKKKDKKKTKNKSAPATRESVLKIERACIAEFQAYLPQLGVKETKMRRALQSQQQKITPEIQQQMQQALMTELESHLKNTKEQLCKQSNCKESDHDEFVQKLLTDKDPEITELAQQSEKLWKMLLGVPDLPDHIDEDAAIEYITRSFGLVSKAVSEARLPFLTENTEEGHKSFKARIQTDTALAAKFNNSFKIAMNKYKTELMAEFKLENDAQVKGILAKFQSSPRFNAAVEKAQKEMDNSFK